MLWPSPAVEVLAGEEVLRLSPPLEKGYVSVDDGVQRFVGTVAPTWGGLAQPDRRQIVARVASALNRHGVESLILVDADHGIQARYENRTLLWLAPPETAGG